MQTGVARIQKVEWLAAFIAAHERALSTNNILGGFRGTAARLIRDQPGDSETTTENYDAKPPLYIMILIPIAVGDCPLHGYICAI